MRLSLSNNQIVEPPEIPDSALFNIEVIAHALSMVNRFGGHNRFPLSVAQHSVWVSQHCARAHALQGLLHDASEAFLVDIPAPWKRGTQYFEGYRLVEAELQQRIYTLFGLPSTTHFCVERVDHLALEVEMVASYAQRGWFLEPSESALELAAGYTPWPWYEAENRFLERYAELAV